MRVAMIKKIPMIAKPVSFRVRFNGKNEKVILSNGQSVHFFSYTEDEEGFTRVSETFVRRGNMLEAAHHVYARDCDGPFETYVEYVCHINDRFDGYKGMPNWKEESYRQRDHYASAMGY